NLPWKGRAAMETTLERTITLTKCTDLSRTSWDGRLVTMGIAALPFVIAWIAVVTTERGHIAWYAEEDNVAENLQVVFLLVGMIAAIGVSRIRWRRDERMLALLYAGLAVACFFVAGEEISWGQRIFGIETPAPIAAHNIQHEINLHNSFLLT